MRPSSHAEGERHWTLVFGLVVIAGAALAACRGGRPEPVELTRNEDSCAACRMAVSNRRFAAQVVTRDGTASFFDDIGCLVEWLGSHPAQAGSGMYVVDYESGRWVPVETAAYVLSDKIESPMAYGLAAFGSRADAERAMARLGGRVLVWHEVAAVPKGRHGK